MPKLLVFPRVSPPAHPHHQRPGEVQPGAKEAYAGGEDLPQPRGVLAVGKRVGRRAIGGVGHRETLPGHGGAARTSALRRAGGEWDDAHAEIGEKSVLEETTELSGLDLPIPR